MQKCFITNFPSKITDLECKFWQDIANLPV